jgi:two-component system, OmpR family, sensor kinase
MKLSHSTRLRIQLWHGVMLGLVTVSLLWSFWQSRRTEKLAEFDNRLQDKLLEVMFLVAPSRSGSLPAGVQTLATELEFGSDAEMKRAQDLHRRLDSKAFYYRVWNQSGDPVGGTKTAQAVPVPDVDLRRNDSIFRTREDSREIIHRTEGDDVVIIGSSLLDLNLSLHRLALRLTIMGAIIISSVLVVGWYLISGALRPVKAIGKTAAQIAEGKLEARIDVSDMDTETELGQLSVALNDTFARLQQNIEQQIRFTADASHELRTPLTIVLTKTQVALSRERTAEEYRAALASCERAGMRMKDLVNSLLELSRFDTGERTLALRPCDLGAIAQEAFDDIRSIAEKHELEVHQPESPLRIQGDPGRLHQVVTNLLANAVKHTPAGSRVKLLLSRQDSDAVLQVRDNGPGIPANALPHLFERFFRVDKARARSEGGSGLGLAISNVLVQAHGGTLSAESVFGMGAIFTVRIPLVAAPPPSAPLASA